MKYKRKAVYVEAVQFDPEQKPWPEGIVEFEDRWGFRKHSVVRNFGFMYIGPKSSYSARINPGDWIVTNPTGERYVVINEFFHTYYVLPN